MWRGEREREVEGMDERHTLVDRLGDLAGSSGGGDGGDWRHGWVDFGWVGSLMTW